MHAHNRHQESQRITLWGILKNAVLSIIKIIVGITGHSQALIADGIHSFSDLLSDILVLIAAKYGSQHADQNHPYGHQRIETAATTALAVMLVLTGIFIIVRAVTGFVDNDHQQPELIVLWVALGSALINEVLFFYTKKVGEKHRSNLLIANAWHHRSDAASSIVAAIGVGGALAGYYYFDAIAALIVGLLIIKMGVELAWSSIQELVDTGVDDITLNKMQTIISSISGVKAVHQLRNRGMGGSIYVDVHIQVNPFLSVSEGHYIAQQVHFNLMAKMPQITDVTVHIDPEDDEAATPSKDLPNRNEILARLSQLWEAIPESKSIKNIILHYLSGNVMVEIKLPLQALSTEKTAEQLQREFSNCVKPISFIKRIELIFY